MTYSELTKGIRSVASALYKRGFRAYDSVLFMASNHIEFPLIFFGVWKAGGNAACLTLNWFPGSRILSVINIRCLELVL